MSLLLPPKKDVALALLERASVFIHLDPRSDEVLVPAWFKKQPQLVLQVGLDMAVRIPDLEVGDEAIACTLSFSRRPHYCFVPWTTVYALVGEDGRGMVWPDDVPPEIAAQTQSLGAARGESRASGGEGRTQRRRPKAGLRPAPPSGGSPSSGEQRRVQDPSDLLAGSPAVPSNAGDTAGAPSSGVPQSGSAEGMSPSERPYLRLVR